MSRYNKMSARDFTTLFSLVELGACGSLTETSSGRLSEILDVSQQSASRRLKHLEGEGYIAREVTPRGQKVKITSKGLEELRSLFHLLQEVFEARGVPVHLSGEVTSGMGDGSYYMGIEEYAEQFKEKLGFEPYPGTLNLKLATGEDIRQRAALAQMRGIYIEGFSKGGRRFGAVRCFRGEVCGRECAAVMPARTHHLATIELIAPEKLRESLNLRDGDIVDLVIK